MGADADPEPAAGKPNGKVDEEVVREVLGRLSLEEKVCLIIYLLVFLGLHVPSDHSHFIPYHNHLRTHQLTRADLAPRRRRLLAHSRPPTARHPGPQNDRRPLGRSRRILQKRHARGPLPVRSLPSRDLRRRPDHARRRGAGRRDARARRRHPARPHRLPAPLPAGRPQFRIFF